MELSKDILKKTDECIHVIEEIIFEMQMQENGDEDDESF